mmetsp:Transcript_31411/g.93296  ORF Transcript_31411/g.93296 Transcript_31411/m.93296 type:complete len:91 (-) Transcript_31411:153-425(-)
MAATGAACMGFAAPGLVKGASCWLMIGVLATIIAQTCLVKETPKITKTESRQLAMVVVWGSVTCMGLFWAFVYMHQMVPLMYPVHTPGMS